MVLPATGRLNGVSLMRVVGACRSTRQLRDRLRMLAGGRGWLVEEAVRKSTPPPGPARLGDVTPYILERRIEIEGDEDGTLAELLPLWEMDADG